VASPVSANKPVANADISIDSFIAGISSICGENEKIQYPNRLRVKRRLNNTIQMQHRWWLWWLACEPPMVKQPHEKSPFSRERAF